MAEPIRVLFLPASGEGVGGGHVLRCLALAEALRAAGGRAMFATEPEGRRILLQFGGDVGIDSLDRPADLPALAARLGADAVVVDDYAMSAAQEQGLGDGRLLVAIDDLADRPHAARLLVDPSYGRDPRDYHALLPKGGRVLAGPSFALLRGAFRNAQAIAIKPSISRLFVSFGLADPGGVAARTLTVLLPAVPDVRIDVALGAGARSLPALRRLAASDPRLHLHVESNAIASIMAGCEMAVGAGGSSTWERAVLGLPSLSVVVADNQRALARALAAQGAHLTLEADASDFDTALPRAAAALVGDMALRRSLARTSRALCDGRGADRVAQAILQAVSANR